MKNNPLLITTLCLDKRTRKAFELYFRSVCENRFVLTADETRANVIILDMDAVNGHQEYVYLRKNEPSKPVILLSLVHRELEETNAFLIRKPIDHNDLLKILNRLAAGIDAETVSKVETHGSVDSNHAPVVSDAVYAANCLGKEELVHFVGEHADIDINKPREVLAVTYSPEKMFQGAVCRAVSLATKHQTPIEVVAFGIGVVIDPAKNLAYSAVNDSVLRPLCLLETEDPPQYRRLKERFLEQDLYTLKMKKGAKLTAHDIEAFIWKISLWSSRGRVPKNTNLRACAGLTAWPNLTRLEPIPDGLRITALMMRELLPLVEVAKQLNLPQRYVFSFYSAARALGYANNLSSSSMGIVKNQHKLAAGESRSILGKLLNRLTKKPAVAIPQKHAV